MVSCIKFMHADPRHQGRPPGYTALSVTTKKSGLRRSSQSPIHAEALLGALPHPLLVIGEGLTIEYANTAAEDFFQMSADVLCRRTLTELVAFGSPLIALVEQVQRNDTTV